MSRQGYRHELKYLINHPDWALLRMRLSTLMVPDPNAGPTGEYTVRSLYFDDYRQTAYHDKEQGVLTRCKYRIRVYNCSSRSIRLERKTKYGQYIHKESAPMTLRQVGCVLDGEYEALLEGDHTLLKEFYFECTSNLMRPRVMVDYDREPFIMEAGDVRITFDKHVRAGLGTFSLLDPGLPTCDVIPGDKMILEVKFTAFLPGIIRQLLPLGASDFTAASKYVLCYDAAVKDTSILQTEGFPWTAH